MKRLLAILLVSLCPAASLAANAVQEAHSALEGWEPLAIEQDGPVLLVVSKERRVSETVYGAMIRFGLCAFVAAGKIELRGIEMVAIVNRFGGSGWVLERAPGACRDITKAPRGEINLELLKRTSLY